MKLFHRLKLLIFLTSINNLWTHFSQKNLYRYIKVSSKKKVFFHKPRNKRRQPFIVSELLLTFFIKERRTWFFFPVKMQYKGSKHQKFAEDILQSYTDWQYCFKIRKSMIWRGNLAYCMERLKGYRPLGLYGIEERKFLQNLAKCIKICYIFGIRKPTKFFFWFHATLFFMATQTRAFIRGKNKVARKEKMKKTIWNFAFQKYGKF